MNIVAVSGGFDPLHFGHIHLFNNAAEYGHLIVLVNSDKWLCKKKGKFFMTFEERLFICRNIKSVSSAIGFADDEQGTCINGLKDILSNYPRADIYFANGGDRKEGTTPEVEFCYNNNITMLWNMDGGNTRSSSKLLQDYN